MRKRSFSLPVPVNGITGIASTSQAKSLEVAGFPAGLEALEKKGTYSDRQFVSTLNAPIPATTTQPSGIQCLPPGMVC